MIRLELTDQDLSDIAEALDHPANSEKNKTKLLVIRMHHEGAKNGNSSASGQRTTSTL